MSVQLGLSLGVVWGHLNVRGIVMALGLVYVKLGLVVRLDEFRETRTADQGPQDTKIVFLGHGKPPRENGRCLEVRLLIRRPWVRILMNRKGRNLNVPGRQKHRAGSLVAHTAQLMRKRPIARRKGNVKDLQKHKRSSAQMPPFVGWGGGGAINRV